MKMPRGAVITGTIVDQYGQPAAQVSVAAMAFQTKNGESVLSAGMIKQVTTDDRGTYRMFGLPPGIYAVAATPRGNVGSGELRQVTADEVQWALQQLAASGARGGLSRPPGQSTSVPPAAAPIGYSSIYYPGTANVASAAKVTLAAGEERTAVSFGLQFVPTATIDGMVVDTAGQPVTNATLSLLPKSIDASPDAVMMLETGFRWMSRPGAANGKFCVAQA